MTYPGTNFRTSVFYKSVFAFSKIFGIENTASLLGITVEEVKKTIDILNPKEFSTNRNALIAYHFLNVRNTNYMITVDVTNRIILDVWPANNKLAIVRRILKHSSEYRIIIIPDDEDIVARLRLKRRKDTLLLEATSKSNNGNYSIADINYYKLIRLASLKVLGSIIANEFVLDQELKKRIIGFF